MLAIANCFLKVSLAHPGSFLTLSTQVFYRIDSLKYLSLNQEMCFGYEKKKWESLFNRQFKKIKVVIAIKFSHNCRWAVCNFPLVLWWFILVEEVQLFSVGRSPHIIFCSIHNFSIRFKYDLQGLFNIFKLLP